MRIVRLHTPTRLVQARGEGHPQRRIVPVAATVLRKVDEVLDRAIQRLHFLQLRFSLVLLIEEVLAIDGLGKWRVCSGAAHQGKNLNGVAVAVRRLCGQAAVQYLVDELPLLSRKDDVSGQTHGGLEGVVPHGDELRPCALVVVSRIADERGLLAR